MKVAEGIRGVLAERGMCIAELSRRSGVPYRHLASVLNGRVKMTADEFVSIVGALEISADDFAGE